MGHVYAEVAASRNRQSFSRELQRRFATAFRRRARSIHSAAEWAEIVDETFVGLVVEPPSKTFFPELYERFAQPSAWRIYADVGPTLTALAGRGLKLGVISNWDERLRPLLNALGLARSFETIVVSCEVGLEQTDACNFFKRARSTRGAPHTILHVGDSFEMDLQVPARLDSARCKSRGGQTSSCRANPVAALDLLPLV